MAKPVFRRQIPARSQAVMRRARPRADIAHVVNDSVDRHISGIAVLSVIELQALRRKTGARIRFSFLRSVFLSRLPQALPAYAVIFKDDVDNVLQREQPCSDLSGQFRVDAVRGGKGVRVFSDLLKNLIQKSSYVSRCIHTTSKFICI